MINDFIEAVIDRPKMYTLYGTYPETVSFLEGYYSGLAKDPRAKTYVETWSSFRYWLSKKFKITNSASELIVLHEKFGDISLEMFASFYHEFKNKKNAL